MGLRGIGFGSNIEARFRAACFAIVFAAAALGRDLQGRRKDEIKKQQEELEKRAREEAEKLQRELEEQARKEAEKLAKEAEERAKKEAGNLLNGLFGKPKK